MRIWDSGPCSDPDHACISGTVRDRDKISKATIGKSTPAYPMVMSVSTPGDDVIRIWDSGPCSDPENACSSGTVTDRDKISKATIGKSTPANPMVISASTPGDDVIRILGLGTLLGPGKRVQLGNRNR